MVLNARALSLYLVTDRALCAQYGLTETVAAAVRGGVSFVQLRDKTATTAERAAMARTLKHALRGTNVPLVVNDDIDAAIAANVDGVHIGQSDTGARATRARLGPDKIIGLSCDIPDHVRAADPALVDYLGLGTVFPTGTKSDHKPAIGFDGLARLAALAPCPTVAIGGLKPGHCADVLRAGCDGMAVVSAICGHPNPETAAHALRQELEALI